MIHLFTHLTQKKLFEFSLIKKTILDIHNELIKIGVRGQRPEAAGRLPLPITGSHLRKVSS
jgi:hypothetical protein